MNKKNYTLIILVIFLASILVLATLAFRKSNDKKEDVIETPVVVDTNTKPVEIPVPDPVVVPDPVPPSPIQNEPEPTPIPDPLPTYSFETRSTIYVTGYTYWDNTPPGSSEVSNPIIHEKAGGTGSYVDPITVAVGHMIKNGQDILDYPAGTKFYIPNLKKYFIVEDTCGDGDTPQNGPCHSGFPPDTTSWLDIWIDGESGSSKQSNNCAEAITGKYLVIRDPAANYAVNIGPVFQNGSCAPQFGNTIILN